MHGIMRMWISKELSERRRYTPTSMAKAKLVDKEYPKLGQRCLHVLFLSKVHRLLQWLLNSEMDARACIPRCYIPSPSPASPAILYKDVAVIPILVTS
jgi:hypothetical protein